MSKKEVDRLSVKIRKLVIISFIVNFLLVIGLMPQAGPFALVMVPVAALLAALITGFAVKETFIGRLAYSILAIILTIFFTFAGFVVLASLNKFPTIH